MQILLLSALVPMVWGLYEEQAGLVDWHRLGLGSLSAAQFYKHQALVATEASVVASVDMRNGNLLWRQTLPQNEAPVDLLRVLPGTGIFTLNGPSCRLWAAATGALRWDQEIDIPSEASSTDAVVMKLSSERLGIVVLSGNAVQVLSGQNGNLLWRWSSDDSDVVLKSVNVDTDSSAVRVIGYSMQAGSISGLYVVELDARTGDLIREEHPKASSAPSSDLVSFPGAVAFLGATDPTNADRSLHIFKYGSEACHSVNLSSVVSGAPIWRDVILSDFDGEQHGLSVLHLQIGSDWHELLSIDSDLNVRRLEVNSKGRGSMLVTAAAAASTTQKSSPRLLSIKQRSAGFSLTLVTDDGLKADSAVVAAESMTIAARGKAIKAFAQLADRRGGSDGAAGKGYVMRVLVGFEDHSMCTVQMVVPQEGDVPDPNILWVREESLSNILQMVSVELPAEALAGDVDMVGVLESGSSISSALARWQHQANMFSSGILSLFSRLGSFVEWSVKAGAGGLLGLAQGSVSAHSDAEAFSFGFKRVLITLTSPGKIIALHSETGEELWSVYYGGLVTNAAGVRAALQLYVTRKHVSPEIMVLDPNTGFAVWHNAVTGTMIRKQPAVSALEGSPSYIHQAMLLNTGNSEEAPSTSLDEDSRVLLALDTEGNTHIYPDNASSRAALAKPDVLPSRILFYYKLGGDYMKGVGFANSGNGEEGVLASERWRVAFPSGHHVAAVASVNPSSRVNSPARTLGDDSVLIKYLNPHVVAVATVDDKNSGLTVMLLDTVTGSVLHRIHHKRATHPVHLVRFENWVVYTYWNDKVKRTELGSITLYDGAIDPNGLNPWTSREENSTGMGTTFSSFIPGPEPIVLHRTYSLPTSVQTLSVTDTFRGVSGKKILLGLLSGQVAMLDRRFLDPRRPDTAPNAQQKKEGLMQYHPELPIIPTQVISYNRTVERLRAIYPIPARLESTTLVFAVGLDLFYTRTTPSQPFDLLAEDFNYALLVILTVGLTAATIAMSKALKIKLLKSAWQ